MKRYIPEKNTSNKQEDKKNKVKKEKSKKVRNEYGLTENMKVLME